MTDVINSPPSRPPADDDSLVGLLRIFTVKLKQQLDDMLPAQVMAYDREANIAQVQPLIAMVNTNNIIVQRAQIAAVPVLQLGGGGFVLSFPIQTGDLGWIKANDRDISIFKQTHLASPPNTQRAHSFSDAVFIPDTMLQGVTIAEEDDANAVLQSLDGSVRIALWSNKIKLTVPSVSIGDTEGYTPNAKAILDLQSTTKAFMPPRMTTGQRDAISPPAEGMVIWNTTVHALQSYNGSAWG